MAKVAPVVKHEAKTNAAPDPLALVDGPTWDNDPHVVTGLETLDATADVDKPVSTAQAAALALKANLAGGNAFIGTQTISPAAGTVNQGVVVVQTAPSSGTPVGPVLFNRIDVTNPGLGASGGGLDNFGGQNILYGLRATMSVTGASSGAGSAAFGGFTNIRAASDGFGGALGVTVTGTGPSGHNSWGNIGYGIVFNGGAIGLMVGLEGEVAVCAGATASIRVGVSSNSQGPVQGSVLDAAFAANTINIGAAGGNAAPWQHLMALSGNMYSGIGMPLATTGDFFFSDTAGTVAHFANLSNITVTGNILSFPNVVIAGNGGAYFGGAGTPLAGQLFVKQPSGGQVLLLSALNTTSGSTAAVLSDVSGNNVLVGAVGEAGNTAVRFGQTFGNWAELVGQGSTNLGLLFGTVGNTPVIFGTNNLERARLQSGLSVGTTTDPGVGVINLATGLRIGNAAPSNHILLGNGTNYVDSALGSGVGSALGSSLNATGGLVGFGGSAGTLTANITGNAATATSASSAPLSGVSGLGTGVATALAIATRGAGGFAPYTEGVWTPTVTASTTAGTPAYGIQVGSYEQIGRQVTARFTIQLSGWTGSPAGNVIIGGLPVASSSATNDFGTLNLSHYNQLTGLAAGSTGVGGVISPGATNAALLQYSTTGETNVTAAQFGTTGVIIGTFVYHV